MHEVNHTLPDQILMAYSTGMLPQSFDLVVATHVSICDDSRARLESFDAIGGAVLEQSAPAEMAEGSLDHMLSVLSQGNGSEAVSPRSILGEGVFPEPLQTVVGGDLDAVEWRGIGMGCKQAVVYRAGESSVRLLQIPGGVGMPEHSHGGTEMTLVLQGAYRDEVGRFARGDVEVGDSGLMHTPVAEGDEPCICLVANEARLKFTTLLPKLAQPFLGI
ncbi:MAG: ChrR family anti-sigma-E factor [Pseudomonadota bacterium]